MSAVADASRDDRACARIGPPSQWKLKKVVQGNCDKLMAKELHVAQPPPAVSSTAGGKHLDDRLRPSVEHTRGRVCHKADGLEAVPGQLRPHLPLPAEAREPQQARLQG